jgi:hypothetical protein
MATKDISDGMVCKAYQVAALNHSYENWNDPYDLLHKSTGQCYKVVGCAIERAIGRGLIECGVSARTGWLTPKGEEVLQAYNVKMMEILLKTLGGDTIGEVAVESEIEVRLDKLLKDELTEWRNNTILAMA